MGKFPLPLTRLRSRPFPSHPRIFQVRRGRFRVRSAPAPPLPVRVIPRSRERAACRFPDRRQRERSPELRYPSTPSESRHLSHAVRVTRPWRAADDRPSESCHLSHVISSESRHLGHPSHAISVALRHPSHAFRAADDRPSESRHMSHVTSSESRHLGHPSHAISPLLAQGVNRWKRPRGGAGTCAGSGQSPSFAHGLHL